MVMKYLGLYFFKDDQMPIKHNYPLFYGTVSWNDHFYGFFIYFQHGQMARASDITDVEHNQTM